MGVMAQVDLQLALLLASWRLWALKLQSSSGHIGSLGLSMALDTLGVTAGLGVLLSLLRAR